MYHRFNENKYPSTNIKMDIFEEHINIIKNSDFSFHNPNNFDEQFKKPKQKKEILITIDDAFQSFYTCLLYTSPSPRDGLLSRMPSSA